MDNEKKKPFNLKSFVISTLRRASYRMKPRSDALKAAKIGRNQYVCAQCKKVFGRKDIAVDHMVPCVGPEGWIDYETFIQRLYCESDGLQVLCRETCHANKTQQETSARKEARNLKKS